VTLSIVAYLTHKVTGGVDPSGAASGVVLLSSRPPPSRPPPSLIVTVPLGLLFVQADIVRMLAMLRTLQDDRA
jgi:hypothetical protein